MGREMRRREERINRKKKNIPKQEELNTSVSSLTILKVVSAIILILLVAYYILAVFITKEIDISKEDNSSSSSETSNASSVSNAIVGKNIFNQKEESYYVYCYDFKNEDSGVAESINGKTDVTIYRMDTSSGLNSKYVTSGEGNQNATGLDNLSVSNPTLLVITGDRITGYYEGRNNIIKFLGE